MSRLKQVPGDLADNLIKTITDALSQSDGQITSYLPLIILTGISWSFTLACSNKKFEFELKFGKNVSCLKKKPHTKMSIK